jgi:hypothetical protein
MKLNKYYIVKWFCHIRKKWINREFDLLAAASTFCVRRKTLVKVYIETKDWNGKLYNRIEVYDGPSRKFDI